MVAPCLAQHVAQFGYLPDYPAILSARPPQQARPGHHRPRRLAGCCFCEVRQVLVVSLPPGLAISKISPGDLKLPPEVENLLSGQLKEARDPHAQAAAVTAGRQPRDSRHHFVGNTKCLAKMADGGEPE